MKFNKNLMLFIKAKKHKHAKHKCKWCGKNIFKQEFKFYDGICQSCDFHLSMKFSGY